MKLIVWPVLDWKETFSLFDVLYSIVLPFVYISANLYIFYPVFWYTVFLFKEGTRPCKKGLKTIKENLVPFHGIEMSAAPTFFMELKRNPFWRILKDLTYFLIFCCVVWSCIQGNCIRPCYVTHYKEPELYFNPTISAFPVSQYTYTVQSI